MRHILIIISLLMASLFSHAENKLKLTSFVGDKELVNSFLIADQQSALLIDAQIDDHNAENLLKLINKNGGRLNWIFISHSHPDHYLGLATLLKTYPKAQVLVANQNIKSSIIKNTEYMQSKGYLGIEAMRTDNFDYEDKIKVVKQPFIQLNSGAKIYLQDEYLPSETTYISTAYSPDLNAFFASDLAYNKVHPWLGNWIDTSVKTKEMENWALNLAKIKKVWGDKNPTIYSGHGAKGDFKVFADLIEYMQIFNFVVKTSSSQREAYGKMVMLYPDYKEADLFLHFAVNNHIKPH